MSTSLTPPPAPLLPSQRARSFIIWAFVISIAAHFLIGGLVPYKNNYTKDQEVEKVSVTKKTKLVVPTPPPTPTPPPPTPPPKNTPPPITSTQPPPQPKLKLNVPKTTSKGENSSAENSYVAPKNGTENGVPQGTVATGPPAPTAGPATAPPAPTPTPKTCAQPHLDATTTQAVPPDYPEMARQQGAAGVSLVRVQLDASGHVLKADIYKSSGNFSLDQSAIQAAKASKYRPEVNDCVPTGGQYIFHADFDAQ
jgi:protein TonB